VSETQIVEAPAADQQVAVANDSTSVDLVLEDVRPGEPATLVAGPSYQVKFRNQGLQDCGRFRIAVVAALNEKPSNAKTVLDVPGLAGGEAREVTLRLPISSMKLVDSSSSLPAAFSHLVVALDPDNAVMESDKSNNSATIERTALEQ
jgi:CARDB